MELPMERVKLCTRILRIWLLACPYIICGVLLSPSWHEPAFTDLHALSTDAAPRSLVSGSPAYYFDFLSSTVSLPFLYLSPILLNRVPTFLFESPSNYCGLSSTSSWLSTLRCHPIPVTTWISPVSSGSILTPLPRIACRYCYYRGSFCHSRVWVDAHLLQSCWHWLQAVPHWVHSDSC